MAGGSTGVTSLSGGTRPPAASVSRARHSSSASVSSGGGPSSTVTTQSWQASPRTRQVSQSILVVMPLTLPEPTDNDPPTGAVRCVRPALSADGPTVHHMSTTASRPHWEAQRTFDELGRPLRDQTFCVVDLETTGGSAEGGSMITEVGAVKVRGGEVLGEFQTLVNPHSSIPPFIAVLTGITDSMVAGAPPIEQVLPQFLEFAAGSVLVAHNAPFDVGFLRHFALAQGRSWPAFDVVDTAVVARRVVTRDESPNCRLSSLARVFQAETVPNHRALSDARATVDVLHGLIARLGNL